MKRCLSCQMTFDHEGWHCQHCGYEPETSGDYAVFAPALAQQNETYSDEFFSELAQLEKGNFWFEARNDLLVWAVQKYLPGAKKILEVGCGTGFVLEKFQDSLPGIDLFASDLLVEGLSFAATRVPSAVLYQMDARDIPYRQEFDLVGVFDVIEHIDEDEAVLAQIYQAIKPGGGIMITVPQHQFLWSAIDDLSYHKRRYERDELIDKVRRAGFQVVKTTSFVSLLLPAMLLSRSVNSGQKTVDDFYAQFTLNPLLNKLFLLVMTIERWLIKLGLPFRWGGSRFLLAVRPE